MTFKERLTLPNGGVRQMRVIAAGLLVAMAGLFFLARTFEHHHPAWGYVRAFAEAAMVGGLADWFAVTALFRHPLGLPIPHTAIIPENKNRIADTMAVFLRTNFLTPAVVARRIQGLNLATAAGNVLAEQRRGDPSRLREGAANLFAVLQRIVPQLLSCSVAGSAYLRNWISATGISPAIAIPTERPMIPSSERLVSNTRLSPNVSWSPIVAA